MTPEGLAEAIPFTAWEQMSFVALVAVIVVALLAWMSYENRTNRAFQASEAKKRDDAQNARDAEWRSFLSQQRAVDQQLSSAVKESLDALTAATVTLISEVKAQRADFAVHDQKEWARLDEMSERIRANRETPTQPRTRRGRTEQ